MSKKLYLQRPGQKPLKLAFTADDMPILWEYYERVMYNPLNPKFSDLPIMTMHNMADTVSFKLFKLCYLGSELKTSIKNFFRWDVFNRK
jgi:hypothetical protein